VLGDSYLIQELLLEPEFRVQPHILLDKKSYPQHNPQKRRSYPQFCTQDVKPVVLLMYEKVQMEKRAFWFKGSQKCPKKND